MMSTYVLLFIILYDLCRIYDAGVLFGGLFAIDPRGRVGYGYILL